MPVSGTAIVHHRILYWFNLWEFEEGLDIIKKSKPDDVLNAYFDAPKKGLNTELCGKNILYWSKIFLEVCKRGLEDRSQINKKGNN